MAQIMRCWAHPIQGTGSNSYVPRCFECGGYSDYPMQVVNFGETIYDWANMPDEIDDSSPVEQIDAVAALSYHCGVAVNMQYQHHSNGGSGAYSEDVSRELMSHFGYAPCELLKLDTYGEWIDKLKESILRRHPVYYSGNSETGGHAFVCDGLDSNDLFHFNYGWGGSSDGFFAPDAIKYSHSDVGAIFNIMPDYVYDNTSNAPSDFTVTPFDGDELSATLSWTNPTMKLDSTVISHIDKLLVLRSGKVIYEETDAVPGATMIFVDDKIPYYSYFDYSVYVVIDGVYGEMATVKNVFFGPSCNWKVIVKTSDSEGMFDTYINIYDHNNVQFMTISSDSSDTTTFEIPVPLGNVRFGWETTEPEPHLYSINIVIKDAADETVYEYTGTYSGLEYFIVETIPAVACWIVKYRKILNVLFKTVILS